MIKIDNFDIHDCEIEYKVHKSIGYYKKKKPLENPNCITTPVFFEDTIYFALNRTCYKLLIVDAYETTNYNQSFCHIWYIYYTLETQGWHCTFNTQMRRAVKLGTGS